MGSSGQKTKGALAPISQAYEIQLCGALLQVQLVEEGAAVALELADAGEEMEELGVGEPAPRHLLPPPLGHHPGHSVRGRRGQGYLERKPICIHLSSSSTAAAWVS